LYIKHKRYKISQINYK